MSHTHSGGRKLQYQEIVKLINDDYPRNAEPVVSEYYTTVMAFMLKKSEEKSSVGHREVSVSNNET